MKQTPITLALALAGALSFTALAGAQTGAQSGQTGQSGMSGETQSDRSDRSGDNRADKDRKFIEKAALSNMAEIQLSQLAVQNAQDPQVKQYAQMMVDEHQKAQDQLQQVASASGVSLPSQLDKKHQKMQDKLQGLSGQEFDRQYVKMMVASHKEAEDLLEDRADDAAAGGSGSISGSATDPAGTSGSTSGTSGATGTSGSTSGTSGATGTSGSTGASSVGAGSVTDVTSYASMTLPKVQSHLQQAKDLEKQLKNQGGRDDRDDK